MVSLIVVIAAFYWLIIETDYLSVRLPVGTILKPFNLQPQIDRMYREWVNDTFIERITWDVCVSRYGNHFLSCGVNEPLCGWDWLRNNTHPIPQVQIDFTTGGVRYHWNIKDLSILKAAITATHARPKKGYPKLHFKRNKLGGLVAPLPAK